MGQTPPQPDPIPIIENYMYIMLWFHNRSVHIEKEKIKIKQD